jgi:hypothetical protein
MDHICPCDPGALCNSPDGVSQFQYPGLARPLALYCADGLVFYAQAICPLAAAHKTAEFKIYPGAPHGFHADYRSSYRKEAAEDAWNQMQAWLKKYNVLS